MKSIVLVALVMLIVCAGRLSATIRNVPATYSTIQTAIDASVNSDTVLVAPGTYAENIVFRGKDIVVTSRFFLSFDPTYIQSTIINGSTPAFADSGSCVRIVNGEDSSAVLQGFTLTGGYGTLWQDEHGPGRYWEGGGVFIALSSPTIKFNIIRNNNVNRTGGASTGGGGIRLGDGAPRILNNIIIANAGMYGGGIVSNYALPTVRNNVVAYNVVSQGVAGPTYGGGGLWFNGAVAGNKVENNTIVGNSATGGGSSGAQGRGGGMIAVFGATINTRDNVVWGNMQTTGGQVAAVSAFALVTYSNIEGGFTGQGNINLLPQFTDTSFYLQSISPCIDAGDTSVAFNDPPNPNNPALAEWPARGGLRNDMGAYGGPLGRIIAGVLTSAGGEEEENVPAKFDLSQNYPNPFNPGTVIDFQLPTASFVSLKVFDILGREVTTLAEGFMQPGSHTSVWNAGGTASGIYIYKLSAGESSVMKKLILIK
jgi:hypothetical protein